MSAEQRDLLRETSLPVITPQLATAALGTLPPTGFVKKMDFSNFVKKHHNSLMTPLKKAEKFAMEEVAPSVDRDLRNAALGQVQNGNAGKISEINPTPRVDRGGQPILGTRIVARIEESDKGQDHEKPSYKRVKMDL